MLIEALYMRTRGVLIEALHAVRTRGVFIKALYDMRKLGVLIEALRTMRSRGVLIKARCYLAFVLPILEYCSPV